MDGRFNLDNPTVLRAFGIQAGPPKKKEDTRHKKADMGDYARYAHWNSVEKTSKNAALFWVKVI